MTFCFIETGTVFIKDGKQYTMPDKVLQSRMAYRSGMNYQGRKHEYIFRDAYGVIPPERLYVPHFPAHCEECGNRLVCNGCANCLRCARRQP